MAQAQEETVTVEEMRLLWFQWLFDRKNHPPNTRCIEDNRMYRRFQHRFREISNRMGKKGWSTAPLDSRSAVLYARCKKEWDAVQPRV